MSHCVCTGMHISIVDRGLFNEGKQVYRHIYLTSVNAVHTKDFEGGWLSSCCKLSGVEHWWLKPGALGFISFCV